MESDIAGHDERCIYALFRCRPDSRFAGQNWDEGKVMELIEAFETDARKRLVRYWTNLGISTNSTAPHLLKAER